MFDEERQEWERESRGVGEYAKGDPERATGSPSSWAESVPAGIPKPDDWCEHCAPIRSCPPCLRAINAELLAALKTLLNAIPEWTAWDQDDEPDECFEARALIERMERVKP